MRPEHRPLLAWIALLFSTPLQAEEWSHEVSPYVWGAAMEGTTGVRGVTEDVDLSFGDILDNLEMGFMGIYRGIRDRFTLTGDSIYMDLGATERARDGSFRVDIDTKQLALAVAAGYEVAERFEVQGGLRYIDVSTDVAVTGPLGNIQRAGTAESWIDPYVGALYTVPLSETWSLNLYGDVGGFGIGSDFAWQGLINLRWQFSERFGALAAYRYMQMDYESGSGSGRFEYDMAFSGPALGIAFTF